MNNIFQTIKNNRVLVKNFSSLSLLQASNYLFPLITFPYLVRVLGVENFGLVQFAAAFVLYFSIISDYGFNLSATREISIHRENSEIISSKVTAILLTKLFLFILCALVFTSIVLFIPFFNQHSSIYFYSFIAVLGNVLFPLWFFQGIEKMFIIPAVNIGIKLISTVLIFVMINYPSDVLTLVLINSVSQLLVGVISITLLFTIYGVKFIKPEISEIIHQLKDGWEIFLSTISISLYTNSNIFILGLLTNNTYVGYFAAADKIRIAVQGIYSMVGQTIYPHCAKLFNESMEAGLIFLRKIIVYAGSIVFTASLLLFLFSPQIIRIAAGSEYEPSIMVLRIISFLPLIIFLSNIAGIQTMLNTGYKKEFTQIIVAAGVINIILAFILVPMYFQTGTALSFLITEIFVTTAMLIFLMNKRIKLLL